MATLKIFWNNQVRKIMAKTLPDGGNATILWVEHLRCLCSSFLEVHQNSWFYLKIKTNKWHFWALKWVPLLIKSLKDSKNIIKSLHRPRNHRLHQNPLKNLCGSYFEKPSLTFLNMHIKLKHFLPLFTSHKNFGWWPFFTQNSTVRRLKEP